MGTVHDWFHQPLSPQRQAKSDARFARIECKRARSRRLAGLSWTNRMVVTRLEYTARKRSERARTS